MTLFALKHPLQNHFDEFGEGFGGPADQGDQHPAPATEAKNKPAFVNKLNRNDTLTVAHGYINEIRPHQKEDRKLLFVSLSIQCGRERNGDDWTTKYVNVDVLAGSTVHKTLEILEGEYSKDTGGRPFGKFEIRNLTFTPDLVEGKLYTNTRGVLETITFGHLEH